MWRNALNHQNGQQNETYVTDYVNMHKMHKILWLLPSFRQRQYFYKAVYIVNENEYS